ncbi:hypothetical protein CAEBREN_15469 [Caenorhabditis brenneri]|uniref:Skp1-related protein n=1 Tax=Caenorhabditis brenneri TaxID=135651 RepID=G0PA30_CAEBE|nr:hypothetical protein CAEBREN_15469 [Caenorhabditis brenneri]
MADEAAPLVAALGAEPAAPAADAAAPEIFYQIESKDNQVFRFSELAIQQADTLNIMVQTMGYDAKGIIPLENIDGDTLNLVFKWCEHHAGEPIPEDDEDVPQNVVIPPWDEELMKIDNKRLFNLICAANYLNVKQLLNVACKKVANMVTGRTPEEMRIIFGIPSDEEDEAATAAAKSAREDPQEGPSNS